MSGRTKEVNVQGVSLLQTIRETEAVRHFLPEQRNVLDQSLIVRGNERCMCLCAVLSVLCHCQSSRWQVISCSHIISFIVPNDEMSA